MTYFLKRKNKQVRVCNPKLPAKKSDIKGDVRMAHVQSDVLMSRFMRRPVSDVYDEGRTHVTEATLLCCNPIGRFIQIRKGWPTLITTGEFKTILLIFSAGSRTIPATIKIVNRISYAWSLCNCI